jgi:protein TonB
MAGLNGATGGPYRATGGAASLDPLHGVLGMGGRVPVAVVVAVAIVLHAGAAAAGTAAALLAEMIAWNRGVRDAVQAKLAQTYDIDVAKPQELPPEPPKEEKEPEPPPQVAKEIPKEALPPAMAQAAKVLAADPDPNEVLDMRDAIVQGTGETYAGGVTAATGSNKNAVYDTAARPNGVPGGTGTANVPLPPKKDLSRVASISGSTDWSDCPFPAEADADQIDQAFVTLQVKVRADGSADAATVVQDPGHGFGREARKCAMRKRYATALDVDGTAIAGQTRPFRVRFQR